MQTSTPNESEPDNRTDTSTPDRDSRSPQARLEAARKQLHLAYEGLADIDLNPHSRKRLRREIQEADESAKIALDLLANHDVDEPASKEVDA